MQIWKYELKVGVNRVPMTPGAKILSAQMQHDKIVLWALVVGGNQLITRVIYVVGTGEDLGWDPEGWRYVNTVQDGSLVWHVFEEEG
jgi:hypothetical protein